MNISLFLILANYSSVIRNQRAELESKPRVVRRINQCSEILEDSQRLNGFPWMAALYSGSDLICGGSIVIVIAAHCLLEKDEIVPKYNSRNTVFVVKENFIANRILDIHKFIIHDEWSIQTKAYDADIALGILRKPIKFTENIRPVCLPLYSKNAKDLVGHKGYVSRWGSLSSNELLYGNKPVIVELPIEAPHICRKFESGLTNLMSERTFCSGKSLGQGLCKGDSGSGLVQKQFHKYVLRGIVSAAVNESCGGKAHVIFTDVAQFSTWIQIYINS